MDTEKKIVHPLALSGSRLPSQPSGDFCEMCLRNSNTESELMKIITFMGDLYVCRKNIFHSYNKVVKFKNE